MLHDDDQHFWPQATRAPSSFTRDTADLSQEAANGAELWSAVSSNLTGMT